MRGLAFAACLTMGVASHADAQRSTPSRGTAPRVPQLTAVADLRLTAIELGLQGNAFGRAARLGISPDGRIVLTPQYGALIDLDSTGHRLTWKIQIGGRDAEIYSVDRLGWIGDTMWVVDGGYRQIALVNRAGKVVKSLEHPSWVRPAWADRRTFPVFARVRPLALYADRSWLVIPSEERSLLDTPGYDKSFDYILRISEGGSILHTIARLPHDQDRIEITSGSGKRTLMLPVLRQMVWNVSADAHRVAVVTTNARGRDSATYRVTAIGDKGDTIFSRLYPYTPVMLTPAGADSVRAPNMGRVGSLSEEVVRARIAERVPVSYPPVTAVVAGRDNTLWLQLRPTGKPASVKLEDERPWIVLDATGEPIGTLALPGDVVIGEADRLHAWGFIARQGERPVLVRYRITKR